jgi:hypothetical protein
MAALFSPISMRAEEGFEEETMLERSSLLFLSSS